MSLAAYSIAAKGETWEEIVAQIGTSASDWLKSGRPDLVLVFISAHFVTEYEEIVRELMSILKPRHMTGCSGYGMIGLRREYQNQPVVSLLMLRHPDLEIKIHYVRQEELDESSGPEFWHRQTGIGPDEPRGMLVFADPFTVSAEKIADELNGAYPGIPAVGGLASGEAGMRATNLFQNEKVYDEGALVLLLKGPIQLETIVSQGCKPIGEPLIITRGRQNLIYEIAGRPAIEALDEALASLPPKDRIRLQQNIFAGLAINEYLEDFHRGDFLVRHLMGVDQKTGALAVGAYVRTGQTIQFQKRDAESAREDMLELLRRIKGHLRGRPVKAALLCSCSGRGETLFGKADHDPVSVADVLGDFPSAGFFCNGEIGPVGNRSFVHGYTCAVGLILDRA